jgi:hypothetical protein
VSPKQYETTKPYIWGTQRGAALERSVALILLGSLNRLMVHQTFNFHVILLWFTVSRDHIFSGFLYFIIAGFKCCVAAVNSCPLLHFSVVIFPCLYGSLIPTLTCLTRTPRVGCVALWTIEFRRNGQGKNEIWKLTKGNTSKIKKCRAAVSVHVHSYQ